MAHSLDLNLLMATFLCCRSRDVNATLASQKTKQTQHITYPPLPGGTSWEPPNLLLSSSSQQTRFSVMGKLAEEDQRWTGPSLRNRMTDIATAAAMQNPSASYCSNILKWAVRYKRGLRAPACRICSPSLHQAKVLQENPDLSIHIVLNWPHHPGNYENLKTIASFL